MADDRTAADELRALLDAEPPASVLALDATELAALVELMERARRRQAQSLQEAFTASMKHVPFPVRGIVRKVLMG